MKKLKNKVFYTIFILLSLFLITILSLYNCQLYKSSYESIKDNLKTFNKNDIPSRKKDSLDHIDMKDDSKDIEPPNNNQMMFMDSIIYSVVIDSNGNINVLSHSPNANEIENIKEEAKKIINKGDKTYIGNLYKTRYSYEYKNNKITIIDNKKTNSHLFDILKLSILIFAGVEIIIFFISKNITNWIIKPVIQSFNKQKQFIADASHELKTPLAVIMASSEALETDKEEKKWLNNIQNESERMNKLITSLLDLAKLENDEIKRVYEKNNLSKIVEKTALTYESLLYEKNIDFEYDIQDNIYLNCVPDEIKQVISVLLDNASKHTEKNGNIKIILKNLKNEIFLEVSNTGEPIPSGEEEKIFERFYRIDKSRNRNENRYGLGLAIAKQIVINHNGVISASSENGLTIFKISFKK